MQSLVFSLTVILTFCCQKYWLYLLLHTCKPLSTFLWWKEAGRSGGRHRRGSVRGRGHRPYCRDLSFALTHGVSDTPLFMGFDSMTLPQHFALSKYIAFGSSASIDVSWEKSTAPGWWLRQNMWGSSSALSSVKRGSYVRDCKFPLRKQLNIFLGTEVPA